MMDTVRVFNTDAIDMPHAVHVRREACTVQIDRGNFTQEIRLTVDEAQVLRDQLSNWLFRGGV